LVADFKAPTYKPHALLASEHLPGEQVLHRQ
jgi:hypothetical protein